MKVDLITECNSDLRMTDVEFARFSEKVIIDKNNCLTWIGALDTNGYGTFTRRRLKRHTWSTHIAIYNHYIGPIPKGLQLDHLCRNRACVNVEHLEAVTPRVNTLRGNNAAAINARKTECVRGHVLLGENLFICAGRRRCRACWKMHDLSTKERKKNARRIIG